MRRAVDVVITGPERARVDDVRVEEAEASGATSFEVRG
jgi:hypothetical protein